MYRKLDISEVNRMNASNIKEWVNAYKARTNKTNADIARQIGMTRRSFEARLTGASEFDLSEAITLAKALNVSVSELCTSPFELTHN